MSEREMAMRECLQRYARAPHTSTSHQYNTHRISQLFCIGIGLHKNVWSTNDVFGECAYSKRLLPIAAAWQSDINKLNINDTFLWIRLHCLSSLMMNLIVVVYSFWAFGWIFNLTCSFHWPLEIYFLAHFNEWDLFAIYWGATDRMVFDLNLSEKWEGRKYISLKRNRISERLIREPELVMNSWWLDQNIRIDAHWDDKTEFIINSELWPTCRIKSECLWGSWILQKLYPNPWSSMWLIVGCVCYRAHSTSWLWQMLMWTAHEW